MRFFLYTALLFITFGVNAQDSIQFQKLDFSTNVFGDTASFVLQPDNSLSMKAPSDTNKVYLSKSSTSYLGASWKIHAQMNVNPSNYNNVKFYILSDSSDLSTATNAYYVVIGNNADEVSLYSQTASSKTKVIDGEDKRMDKDTVDVEVVVSLNKDGIFTLWSKRSDEAAYYLEGSAAIKSNYSGTAYLGFLCAYSSKNTDKFIIHEVGIALPADSSNNEENNADNDSTVTVDEENFSLSARSFSNGGEAVYVQYKFPEEGAVARIFTFDASGNKIEELANNTTLDKEGRIRFSANYPSGLIVVLAEARTKDGRFIRKKMPIVCGE